MNTIYFTTTPPAPGYGTTVTLCPNVKLANPSNVSVAILTVNSPCTLQGLWIDHGFTSGTGLMVYEPGCVCSNMLISTNSGVCFRVEGAGTLSGWGSAVGLVATKASYGLYAIGCVSAALGSMVAINCNYGVICDHGNAVSNGDVMVGCNYSFMATNGSVLSGYGYVVLSTIGYASQWQSILNAVGAVGRNWAVTTAWSPATSGTVGNYNAIIQYS